MVQFIIGLVVGSFAAVGILGFLAGASEDQPAPPAKPDEMPWYMEDDGK